MSESTIKKLFMEKYPSGLSPDKDSYIFGDVLNLNEKELLIKNPEFFPKGKVLLSEVINESFSKQKVLDKLRTIVQSTAVSSRITSMIELACDELIMNAFFNAPTLSGKFMYKHIDRSLNVFSPKPVSINLIEQEEEIVLSVKDSYGTLDIKKLIEKINNNLNRAEYVEPSEGTGAGIGLSFLILKNISLIARVNPLACSEFFLYFPKKSIYKDFSKNGKVISLKTF